MTIIFWPSKMAITTYLAIIATITSFLIQPSFSDNSTLEVQSTKQYHGRRLRSTKGYRILTLGGSVTWGSSGMTDRDRQYDRYTVQHYPALLGRDYDVTNMAIRATGSDYPSHCIQSMIGDNIYDVIILEFSLNGIRGLKLLLKRLRLRFPSAIIIYVDLYSLQIEIVDKDGKSPTGFDRRNISEDWKWGQLAEYHQRQTEHYYKRIFEEEGGYIFALPRHKKPIDSRYLFSPDMHHLSKEGHKIVANGIKDIVNNAPMKGYRVNPWGVGDMCFNWFMTGDVPLQYSGEAFERQISPSKHTLGFFGEGSIYVRNNFGRKVHLYLGYLIHGDEYPRVVITINGKQRKIVDPRFDAGGHVVRIQQVGMIDEGKSELKIVPEDGAKLPFRLTSIIMCGECDELAS